MPIRHTITHPKKTRNVPQWWPSFFHEWGMWPTAWITFRMSWLLSYFHFTWLIILHNDTCNTAAKHLTRFPSRQHWLLDSPSISGKSKDLQLLRTATPALQFRFQKLRESKAANRSCGIASQGFWLAGFIFKKPQSRFEHIMDGVEKIKE